MGWGLAQVVGHLPSTQKALSSKPQHWEKKKTKHRELSKPLCFIHFPVCGV
jgi:hypothetical protein